MLKKINKISWALVLVSVLLAACGLGAEQEPTPDVVAIRTQAVGTAMAEMTLQAALNPTATPAPPTITPLPTATRFTLTPAAAGGTTSGGTSSGSTSGGGSKLPTLTPTWPAWSSDDYRCEFVKQDPYDQAQKAGSEYDIVWTMRNIGTRTWYTNLYSVIWMGGDDINPYKIYQLPHNVEPGKTVDIRVDIHLPSNPQDFRLETFWGIRNDKGSIFCRFYHVIPRLY